MSTSKTQLVCLFTDNQTRKDAVELIESLGFGKLRRFEEPYSVGVVLNERERLTFGFGKRKIVVKDVGKIVGSPNFKEFLKKVMDFRDLEMAFIGSEYLEEMPRVDFEYHANPYFFCFELNTQYLFLSTFEEKIAEISKVTSKKEMINLIEKHSWEPIKNEKSIGLLRKFEFADKKYRGGGEKAIKAIREKLESKGATPSKDFAEILAERKEAEKKTTTKRTESEMNLTPMVNSFRKKMGQKPLEKREIVKITTIVPAPKNYLDSYTYELDTKGQFIFPYYFIRKELRKKGIELEKGLAEKYAKELGIE